MAFYFAFFSSFTETIFTASSYCIRTAFLACTEVLAVTGKLFFSPANSTSTIKHFAPHCMFLTSFRVLYELPTHFSRKQSFHYASFGKISYNFSEIIWGEKK